MSMYGEATSRPVVVTDPEQRAHQSFKDECDINNIMRKYRVTGLVTHVARSAGRFADVSEIGSYQDAIDRVRDANEFFSGLPAELRQRFGNDAASFLDFILDPANEAEVRDMGLKETVEPVRASETLVERVEDLEELHESPQG